MKKYMSRRQKEKKQNAPSERSFKRILADFGYSETVADKIWKVYNHQEIDEYIQ